MAVAVAAALTVQLFRQPVGRHSRPTPTTTSSSLGKDGFFEAYAADGAVARASCCLTSPTDGRRGPGSDRAGTRCRPSRQGPGGVAGADRNEAVTVATPMSDHGCRHVRSRRAGPARTGRDTDPDRAAQQAAGPTPGSLTPAIAGNAALDRLVDGVPAPTVAVGTSGGIRPDVRRPVGYRHLLCIGCRWSATRVRASRPWPERWRSGSAFRTSNSMRSFTSPVGSPYPSPISGHA
jgi:hypothetical protein